MDPYEFPTGIALHSLACTLYTETGKLMPIPSQLAALAVNLATRISSPSWRGPRAAALAPRANAEKEVMSAA